MVVVMEPGATEQQIQRVIDRLVARGFDIHRSTGATLPVIGAIETIAARVAQRGARALSDGAQSLFLIQLAKLMSQLRVIASAVGRRLP